MADNPNPEDRLQGNQSQGGQKQSTEREVYRPGKRPEPSEANDRTTRQEDSGVDTDDEEEMPNRDPNKSVNGDEFDREGRNPKPFSIG
jgi:hypothetical protein